MPELQVLPIQKLIWEERDRLGVERPWGLPPCCLRASRRGGWAALSKTEGGVGVKVVVIGKAS